jgi:hypothetical protein
MSEGLRDNLKTSTVVLKKTESNEQNLKLKTNCTDDAILEYEIHTLYEGHGDWLEAYVVAPIKNAKYEAVDAGCEAANTSNRRTAQQLKSVTQKVY